MRRPVLLLAALALLSTAVARAARAEEPAPAAASTPVDLENAKCPVKGVPVVAGVTETVDGKVVHFCCRMCAAKYRADPAKYRDALRADPAVARRMDAATPGPAHASAPGAEPLRYAARGIWEDHVLWTRLYVVSAVAGLPDADAAAKRLLRNQDEHGQAVASFYGAEAGTKLTALLRDHIGIAVDLVKAAKAGDAAGLDASKARWTANADEIAAFLSGANPEAWPLEATKSMMHDHLEITTAEVTARLRKDWQGDVAAFEKARLQALHMSDAISDGIAKQHPGKATAAPPSKERDLRDRMRSLWEEHVLWTRLYVVSAIADLPDADAAAKRLLRNQDDIGGAVGGFFGADAGTKLTTLLKEHITIAVDVVKAAKAGDHAALGAAKGKWTANADEIAAFLSGANPESWPLEKTKAMMREHLDVTTAQVVARLEKDWDADVAAYDRVREQARHMADALSDGIARKFPDRMK